MYGIPVHDLRASHIFWNGLMKINIDLPFTLQYSCRVYVCVYVCAGPSLELFQGGGGVCLFIYLPFQSLKNHITNQITSIITDNISWLKKDG